MKSGKLAVRGQTRKYLALQYTKILQSSAKSRIRPGTMGKMGQTNHEAISKGRPGRLYGRGTNPCVTCWKDPYIGPERGKLREVNPVSAINTDEEKSGKRRAEARGNSAPLPNMAHSPRILRVVRHEFLAIGRLNPVLCLDAIPQVGQMSPRIRDSIIIIFVPI